MTRLLLLLIITSFITQVHSQEMRLALLIGNSDYQSAGTLLNPVNDVNSMEVVLRSVGFDILKYENLSQKEMRRVIDEFGSMLKKYEVGLFFFAGHGIQANGFNYLIPCDALLLSERDIEYNCVRADRIIGRMEEAGNKTNIVIMDACRNNPFERSWSRSPVGNGLAFMNAPVGSLIAYSTSPGKIAYDDAGENGLYTTALLKYILEPDITIIETFQKTRAYVRALSDNKQTPWESTSLEGNFYFNPSVSGYLTSHQSIDSTVIKHLLDPRDGQTYKVVKIGGQTWMAENLNFETSIGSWCYDNLESNCLIYGRLYNSEAKKLACPKGWHLPSQEEWRKMAEFFEDNPLILNYGSGRSYEIGEYLKINSSNFWDNNSENAMNSSGFSALPGGRMGFTDSFAFLGSEANFWIAEGGRFTLETENNLCNYLILGYLDAGYSIRCIKD